MASDASRLALGALAAAVVGVGVIWLVPRPETDVVSSQPTVPVIVVQEAPAVSEGTAEVAPLAEGEVGVPTVGMRAEADGIPVSYTHLTLPTIYSV